MPYHARAAIIAFGGLLECRLGTTAIEYALVAALISIAAMSGILAVAGSMEQVTTMLNAAVAGALAD